MACCQKMTDVIDDTRTYGVVGPTEPSSKVGIVLGILAGIGLVGALIAKAK